MFERSYTIEGFMCENDRLSLRYIGHLLSDIMERNANSYGATALYHHERNLAWVLTEYEVDFHVLPKRGETIMMGTLPYSFKRMFGYRIYRMRHDEHTLLEGKGKFVLINYQTKTIVKPDQALLDLFTDAKQEPEALPFEKMNPSKVHKLYSESTKVLESYIDINRHMNNAAYIALAYDYLRRSLRQSKDITGLKVLYRKEAFYEEILELTYYQEHNGIYLEIATESELKCQILFKQKQHPIE